jgi:hypothetical protein
MNIKLSGLNYDIFLVLFKFLSLNDTYKMMLTTKEFSEIKDDIWGILCITCYSEEFWIRAKARPPSISLPLGTNKKELERLKNFEKSVGDWEIENYYQLWEYYDNCIG